ncbi:hypothetical protein LINGRAHAP2_LOCUS32607 [Linum grandiflorum]
MKPESKKSRGRSGTSSVDTKQTEIGSCYDFSNFSEALNVVVPAESSTRKDGGSAYDFGNLSKELSTIEHREMKVAALKSRLQKRREYFRMEYFRMRRRAYFDAIMCPSPSLLSDEPLRPPPSYLRNHSIPPPPDFLLADDRNEAMIGSAELSPWPVVDVPAVEVEEVNDGGSQASHSATPMIELENPCPIMYRLSRIVSLGNMRRKRRNCRVHSNLFEVVKEMIHCALLKSSFGVKSFAKGRTNYELFIALSLNLHFASSTKSIFPIRHYSSSSSFIEVGSRPRQVPAGADKVNHRHFRLLILFRHRVVEKEEEIGVITGEDVQRRRRSAPSSSSIDREEDVQSSERSRGSDWKNDQAGLLSIWRRSLVR